MKTYNKNFLGQVKQIVKKIPGTQSLNGIRHQVIRIHELSNLINEKRIVVLHPHAGMEHDNVVTQIIVSEVVKDLLDVYGTARVGRKTATINEFPEEATLLYAPLALLNIPTSHGEYLTLVGNKTRNMIRKSEKQGYEFKEFVWNEHLDEIYEINTSRELRQGEQMRGWYREKVQPRSQSTEELLYRKYYGGFKDGKLYAYLHIVLCGDFAFFKHFLGHDQHLTNGIMNGLLSWTVQEYAGNSQIRWLKYGELSTTSSSMHSFRKHAGFRGYAILLDLEGDEELLKYAKKKIRTIWRI